MIAIIITLLMLSVFGLMFSQLSNAQIGPNLTQTLEGRFNRPLGIDPTQTVYGKDPVEHVFVRYESPTTILFDGELSIATGIGDVAVFNTALWEAMDLLKTEHGFKLQQVMTSGVGSVGNPTHVYILMTK